jgi:hypothetical protein
VRGCNWSDMSTTTASVRRWHSYIGLFMAPSVLFFAITGAVQIFSLHEAHGTYRPAAIVEKLSSVHKDQVFKLGHHQAPPEPDAAAPKLRASSAPPPAAEDDDKLAGATLALKVFFLLIAACLTVSTGLGLWMGFTQTRRRRTAWLLVLAGVLIPAGLLLF